MTRVMISEDCGNSPKNIYVRELTIALAKGDTKFILSKVTEDIRWNVVGDTVMEGKENFADALEARKRNKATELYIDHIATHGKAGAVDGKIRFKNKKTYAFCHMYEFSNAKGASINEISSYEIEIK